LNILYSELNEVAHIAKLRAPESHSMD